VVCRNSKLRKATPVLGFDGSYLILKIALVAGKGYDESSRIKCDKEEPDL
jgi:hypothetical protein